MKTPPKTLFKFFLHVIKPEAPKFIILMLVMLGWSLQEAVYPYFIKLTVDKLQQYSSNKSEIFTALSTTLIIWASLWILIEIGFRTYDFLSAKVFPRFQAYIRTEMFNYTILHSHQFFSDNFAGTIASKISRMAEALLNIIILVITIFIPVLVAFCISIFFLYQAKPMFGLIMAGWFLIHLSIAYYFSRRSSSYSNEHSSALTSLNGKIVDIFNNITIVRLFARYFFERQYLQRFQNDEIQRDFALLHYNAVMKFYLGLVSQIFIFVMIGSGLYAWQHDWITLGELTLILTSISLIGLAWYMGMHLIRIFEDIGTCNESLTILKKQHDIVDLPNAMPIQITRGEIQFDRVTFYYHPNRIIFNNKSIHIKAGTKVGLVGYSGSGKTTFVNLILRYFDLQDGHILIDNQDIQAHTQASLRDQIALIPQDTTLFHRSLMENVRYGKLDSTDEEVIEASKKAHSHEFIQYLELGYDTLVGERGIKLSGGQRQRIAIARAILKNAPILILDEATSALDSVTEKYIQESLHYLMKERTTIVIAHRLSTLANMDRILVFHQGEIIEDGTHEALLKQQGHYAKLWNMQAGGFLPEVGKEEK